MLLAIDIGNTQTVIGLFGGDDADGADDGTRGSSSAPTEADLLDHWRIATNAERTSDEHALVVQEFLGFHGFSFDDDID
ncbi:MAG: type III pantothenate kinase, partial [Acidimicrobiales bacterium]|nr:type III pantothenate kinase [Acidimicrobiales bacterium]